MARPRRLFLAHIPQHVITRGVNRQAVFFQAADYRLYLRVLRRAAHDSQCQVHAYVLMTNHVHLLVTPEHDQSLALMMQAMGRSYAQRLNERHGRTGALWGGRYKACLVQTERYLLACQRYIELNPVRAGMVTMPGDYAYSSYRHHALGRPDPVVTRHPVVEAMGPDDAARRRAYRTLFDAPLGDDLLGRLRKHTQACGVMGNDTFRAQVEATLKRTIPTGQRGRPRKN